MTHVVIVGSGFGGCTAVRKLRKQGFDGHITLVSPRPELFYYPSLIWVPSGHRSEADLRIDLRGFLAKHQVTHHAARATGLRSRDNVLLTDAGELTYDWLLIASGGGYLRKLPGIEHAHIVCEGWETVKAYSDKLRALDSGRLAFGFAGNPKEPAAMRGGPIFEFLFGVDTLLRTQGRRDRFQITFFSPAPKPGARLGEKAVERLLSRMRRQDIHTHLGHKLVQFEADKVVTEGGEVPADLIAFIPGMTGPAFAAETDLPLSEGGFFKADETCRSPGAPNVYIAGDCGSFPGPDWRPKQAHMADLQAETAVKNILAAMAGRPAHHRFKTELICIIDSLSTGVLVYRDDRRNFQLPGKPFHWAKVLFEKSYLRPYTNP